MNDVDIIWKKIFFSVWTSIRNTRRCVSKYVCVPHVILSCYLFHITTYKVLISRIDFVVLQHNDFPSIERDFTTFTIKRPSEEVRRNNKSWYMDWNSLWKCKKIICRDIGNIYSIQDSLRIYIRKNSFYTWCLMVYDKCYAYIWK